MELERETGWQLHPIGGETGQAFMGTKNNERLFLKRNSSPFLAALSLEGISPKLVWTKRIGNGDVVTAQEWCNGRTLAKTEMNSLDVFGIIRKVHESKSLKRLFHRLGGKSLSPTDFYHDCLYGLSPELINQPLVKRAINFLETRLPDDTLLEEKVVCHGDISHKNILRTKDDNLYLVDWDSAVLADPAYDISQLLARYIDLENWDEWFSHCNESLSESNLYWYAIINIILDIKNYHNKQDRIRMNNNLLKLNKVLNLY